jgi:hypothetical protein
MISKQGATTSKAPSSSLNRRIPLHPLIIPRSIPTLLLLLLHPPMLMLLIPAIHALPLLTKARHPVRRRITHLHLHWHSLWWIRIRHIRTRDWLRITIGVEWEAVDVQVHGLVLRVRSLLLGVLGVGAFDGDGAGTRGMAGRRVVDIWRCCVDHLRAEDGGPSAGVHVW